MAFLEYPDPAMRKHSNIVIFTVMEFLFTHTMSFCQRVETPVQAFSLTHPTCTIPYLRDILGVVGHVYSPSKLLETITNPWPDRYLKNAARACDEEVRRPEWVKETSEAPIFSRMEYHYLARMRSASSTKWQSCQAGKLLNTRFSNMSAIDKVGVLTKVIQLLEWISWAAKAYGLTEVDYKVHQKFRTMISFADSTTLNNIKGLIGLRRAVGEMKASLLPLCFADGRLRQEKPFLGCVYDCDGSLSGVRKAVKCDFCLQDMPLRRSPVSIYHYTLTLKETTSPTAAATQKIFSEVRRRLVTQEQEARSELLASMVVEDKDVIQQRVLAEEREWSKYGNLRYFRARPRRTASKRITTNNTTTIN
ncbi:MAG: hypothetical protein M1813_000038 [Trichoglossum hirsutum]|nr:MAG: hypothetical protein M1813_000038 [Trichoglossum hirsutum]